MSNYYSNGQLAQNEVVMDRDEIMSDPVGAILLEAQEEEHEEFIYRATVTMAIDPEGNQGIFSLVPMWPGDH